jgi:hypothetical protein
MPAYGEENAIPCDNHLVSEPEVRVLAGRFEIALGADLQIVPSAQVVITVSGARSRHAVLDGRIVQLSSGPTGLISVDLVRSTGFHHLVIDGRSYWFGTQDTKLGLDGIVAMLNELQTMGTGWTGQAIFSDGSGFRDPHVAYGWLDQHAENALSAIASILAAPRTNLHSSRVLRRRGGAGVLLAPTLRLLRSDPRRYLAPSPNGLISAAGASYEPLRVVARKRETTLNTVANRRVLSVLAWLDRLSQEVILASENTAAVGRSRVWSDRARSLQRRPLALSVGTQKLPFEPRQAEETTEPAYRLCYELSQDLRANFAWNASHEPKSRLSYVDQSDAIYQAYTASRIARELGLRQTSSVLGAKQPAFDGVDYDLYYDTTPPATVLRSWRSHSDKPDNSRPDLLLHERATGRIAVLDAKYRIGQDGRASEDSRKDVSAYMALYALASVSILYPGTQDSERVLSGKDRRIVEVSIAPEVADIVSSTAAILSTLQHPEF